MSFCFQTRGRLNSAPRSLLGTGMEDRAGARTNTADHLVATTWKTRAVGENGGRCIDGERNGTSGTARSIMLRRIYEGSVQGKGGLQVSRPANRLLRMQRKPNHVPRRSPKIRGRQVTANRHSPPIREASPAPRASHPRSSRSSGVPVRRERSRPLIAEHRKHPPARRSRRRSPRRRAAATSPRRVGARRPDGGSRRARNDQHVDDQSVRLRHSHGFASYRSSAPGARGSKVARTEIRDVPRLPDLPPR